jgi:putative ABC transport system substrate-binding protein
LGQNIIIEWRHAEGKRERLAELAAELVRLKVDVIVTGGPPATRPAKEATATIPIVMAQDSDLVGNGFVASLERPGGNITGLTTLAPELNEKRLEVLKEIVPKLSRVAVFGTSTLTSNTQWLREIELAAGRFGVKVQFIDVIDPKNIETGFRAAAKEPERGSVSINGASVVACADAAQRFAASRAASPQFDFDSARA